MTYDLVIRGGTVVDGTGDAPRNADVAVKDGVIVEVGAVDGEAKETIDATGLIVTPGWVDIHTHYDGQCTWDPILVPSCWHGVTTAIMGNCGVGFAPVKTGDRMRLIELMEGVEDIPGTALHEGIEWAWETFPEYLDALDKMPRSMDIGAHVPHGPVRTYVMGERGAMNEPASPEDIASMKAIVTEAIHAGALGFSTSRTIMHRAVDGEPVPGTFAAQDELLGLAEGLADADAGVFELAPAGVMGEDMAAVDAEVEWMRKISATTKRPVTFVMVQHQEDPDQFEALMKAADDAVAEGANLYPQVGSRPLMLLIGHQTFHPFKFKPTYVKLKESLPWDDFIAELKRPEVKAAILEEEPEDEDPLMAFVFQGTERIFVLGNPPVYEPEESQSVRAIAEGEGRDDEDVLYDLMLLNNGKEFLMAAVLNFGDFSLDGVAKMLSHPRSIFGLGDGGAHCSAICDATMNTFLLTHWARDRKKGTRFSVEEVIKKLTHDNAELYGLRDRGVVAPGYRADLNVIDFDALQLHPPQIAFDLPGGAQRFIQRADGYRYTIVHGQVVQESGEDTGARPGRLIRGAQPAPSP
jgi:N-acyl-D-aspartate/D-glutamate deacylase